VGVDIDKTHRSLSGLPRTQKGSQHDAAIAAQHNCKTAVAGCLPHPLPERPAIGADFGFVPRPAHGTYIISIRRRDDIAPVAGTQALHQTELAENSRGTI
jgi:hypothetical protein